ncbi:hypothetical protein Moror_3449 [Moniliophthora roreri MCA 2997]|uniref:Uncharacterized protein n=2 Tax=Moniliophthora roreri TaxID=221103 RepID=V2X267_MONRO|nr:hypothetical protein Moror_3449 [Moniliophthora roreri MCA 2997]
MTILYAFALPLAPNGTSFSAEPLTLASVDSSTATCDDLHGCRTVANIVWSCFSVVFICTWVAIHPNVPKHGENGAVVFLANAVIMFLALIAPELIVLWAMRQWFAARQIRKQFKEYGWGMTHAFFVLMGGFALYDDDRFLYPLWEDWNQKTDRRMTTVDYSGHDREQAEKITAARKENEHEQPAYSCLLECLVDQGHLYITKAEIKDRSHADTTLSKVIVIIQTGWFILQCIVRAIKGLAVTELEIVTLAFAFLNFITCSLWWYKPLGVQYPIRVQLPLDTPTESLATLDSVESTSAIIDGLIAIWSFFVSDFYETFDYLFNTDFYVIAFIPFYPFLFFLLKFIQICIGLNKDDGSSRFSSRLKRDPPQLFIACYLIAVSFGALHCIAWFFNFPTKTEQLQWRITSLSVTFLPLVLGFFHAYLDGVELGIIGRCLGWFKQQVGGSNIISLSLCFVLALAYIVARIFLIVIALMALRKPDPTALHAIQWTNFIPHIG